MWPGFRELQCVLAAPAVEKRREQLLRDDSGRRVDMTAVRENLYIGAEYVATWPAYSSSILTSILQWNTHYSRHLFLVKSLNNLTQPPYL